MKNIVFDIETGPLPEGELENLMPRFDPAEVKLGNIKDAEKIKSRIAEAERNHRIDFIEGAALDALTGRVLAIGLIFEDGSFSVIGHDDEAAILRDFWRITRGSRMIGFNSNSFDLPFLIRRSLRHRVLVPREIRSGRYWSSTMVDLRDAWQMGDRQARGSLNAIARHLNLGQKTGQGADFARLWNSDRDRAVAYLRQDVELTARIAEAMRVIAPANTAPKNDRLQPSCETAIACTVS
jgi:uncharacterized protein YprB with RNaseH-like and TPR domain